MKNIAVILAGGVGARLGAEVPKQFLKVAGKSIIEHTIEAFVQHKGIDEVWVVIHASYMHDMQALVAKNGWHKVKRVLNGGSQRYESSLSAVQACAKLDEQATNLIFHDAVRPLVSARIIDDVLSALRSYEAVDVAVPSADTIIELKPDRAQIRAIPNRNFLYRGQTPQAFRLGTIRRAYEAALQDPSFATTDDCGIVAKYLPQTPIFVVRGEESNVKLTYPEDIYLLDKLFQLRSTTLGGEPDLSGLSGKVIAIFGGSSGIGADMARIAREQGADVAVFSRGATGTDIKDMESVQSALERLFARTGRIDMVVNSAAVLNKEPLMHLKMEEIKEIIEINYAGMVNVAMAAYEYLRSSHGALLNFTSSSYTRGRANYALYSSTKAAVVNFTQAIAEEWQEAGIRANVINPQRTKTPMRTANFGIEPEDTLLRPEDVARVSLRTLLCEFSGNVIDVKLTR